MQSCKKESNRYIVTVRFLTKLAKIYIIVGEYIMKQYRNAERTKKWIRRAFTELVAEKRSIDKITVTELAERADITKTTFYYHYDDIYAVVEEMENELIDELNTTLTIIDKENPDDYSAYIRKGLAFIRTNEESYRLVVNASDLNLFANKLKNIFSKRLIPMSTSHGFSSDIDKRTVQAYFVVSACVDTIVQYLKGNLCSSIDTVGDVIVEAIDKLSGKV